MLPSNAVLINLQEDSIANIKNWYCFKNPIRFFLKINNLYFNSAKVKQGGDWVCSWTKPVTFKIEKNILNNQEKLVKGYRTIAFPNIANFYSLFTLANIKLLRSDMFCWQHFRTRIKIDYFLGDFEIGSYNKSINQDLLNLTKYDNLAKFDIKSFYNTIYTHNIDFTKYNLNDNWFASLNNGETRGLLLGNIFSIIFAEQILYKILISVKHSLEKEEIENGIEYFSDDFYIFYKNSFEFDKIQNLFNDALSEQGFELNLEKTQKFNYLGYNDVNFINRYWKKINKAFLKSLHENQNENNEIWSNIEANISDYELPEEEFYYENLSDEEKELDKIYKIFSKKFKPLRLSFLNQLIYRMNKLSDINLQRTFVLEFFKTDIYEKLGLKVYQYKWVQKEKDTLLEELHQFLFLVKMFPEILLYITDNFISIFSDNKKNTMFENLFGLLEQELIFGKTHEKVIYIFYFLSIHFASKMENNKSKLEAIIKKISKFQSKNQLFLSMSLKKFNFNFDNLLNSQDEEIWFLNYSIILNKFVNNEIKNEDLEKWIEEYLIPKKPLINKKQKQIDFYKEFYYKNILVKNWFLNDEDEIEKEIDSYKLAKFNENKFEFEFATDEGF